jgi:hypothetical protein
LNRKILEIQSNQMKRFFESLYIFLYVHKKRITIGLFIAAGISLFLPGQAHAILPLIGAAVAYTIYKRVSGGSGPIESIKDGLWAIVNVIPALLMIIPLILSAAFAACMEGLLEWITSPSFSANYLNSPAVQIGWPIARDFGNMIIVMALVIIAVATILRYQDYEAKKLLPRLILAALLINFSLVIAGVFIDGSNIVTNYFLKGSGDVINKTLGKHISDSTVGVWDKVTSGRGPIEVMTDLAGNIFFNTMSGIITMLFAFLFLFQRIAFWILLILSPITAAFYILPSTRSYYEMWWKQFIQWCMIGMSGSFFYMLGVKMMARLNSPDIPPATVMGGGRAAGAFLDLYKYIVPGVFLIIGFIFTLQTSAMGSGVAIGAFKKTLGAIKTGASATGKYVGKYIGDKSGISKGYANLKTNIMGRLEKLPVVGSVFGGVGTAKLARQAELKESASKNKSAERVAGQSKAERKDDLKKLPGVAGGNKLHETDLERDDYLAKLKLAAEKGELKDLDETEREKAMKYGMEYGMSASDFAKSDPAMAAKLDEKTKKEMADTELRKSNQTLATKAEMSDADLAKAGLTRASTADAQAALDKAEADLTKKNYKKFELSDLPSTTDDELIKMAEEGGAAGARALEEAIKRKILHKVKGGNLTDIAQLLNDARDDFGSTSTKSANNLNPLLAGETLSDDEATKIAADLSASTGTTVAPTDPTVKEEAVNRAYRNASPIADLTEDALADPRFALNNKLETIRKALSDHRNMTPAKINAMKRALGDPVNPAPGTLRQRLNGPPPMPAGPERTTLEEKIDAIDKA